MKMTNIGNKLRSLILLSILFFSSSCGLLFGGRTTGINLIATDPDATVQVELNQNGVIREAEAPGYVSVNRSKSDIIVTVKEDSCYKKSQTVITPGYNFIAFIDVIWGVFGLTSTTVDYTTEAFWDYDNTAYINTAKKSNCK